MGRAGMNGPEAEGQVPQAKALSAESAQPSVPEQPASTVGQPLGLDVSSWQGSVNWAAVKSNGARFAYVKATEGTTYKNPYFGAQIGGATSVGLIRGAYHFAAPSASDGATQAFYFVNNGGGWSADGITMPPTLDIEDNPYGGTNKCYGMSPSQLTTWVRDFTSTIYRLTNKQAMIYTGYWFWRDCLGNTTEFSSTNPLWLASYYTNSPAIPGGWSTYTIWQYANDYADASQTVKATFPGDQNVFNGTMDQLRRLAGTPDFTTMAPPANSTPISGKWYGAGRWLVGWMLDGFWCLQNPNGVPLCFSFGTAGDIPVTGDWNGDGITTIGIVRNGHWYLTNSLTGPAIDSVASFGLPTDIPVTGDWSATGRTGIGIFRNGVWALSNGSAGAASITHVVSFGQAGDAPLAGDWDANGTTTIGIFRNNVFALGNSNRNSSVASAFPFGNPGDRPLAGDWNGNWSTTVGLRRTTVHFLSNTIPAQTVDAVVY